MTASEAITAGRPKLSVRTGASRKLLERKAVEKAEVMTGDAESALEDDFPAPVSGGGARDDGAAPLQVDQAEMSAESAPDMAQLEVSEAATAAVLPSVGAPPAAPAAAVPTLPAPAPAWSAEDESHLQSLLARRKAPATSAAVRT